MHAEKVNNGRSPFEKPVAFYAIIQIDNYYAA